MWDTDDIWYYEEVLEGKEALVEMNYDDYIKELKRRLI